MGDGLTPIKSPWTRAIPNRESGDGKVRGIRKDAPLRARVTSQTVASNVLGKTSSPSTSWVNAKPTKISDKHPIASKVAQFNPNRGKSEATDSKGYRFEPAMHQTAQLAQHRIEKTQAQLAQHRTKKSQAQGSTAPGGKAIAMVEQDLLTFKARKLELTGLIKDFPKKEKELLSKIKTAEPQNKMPQKRLLKNLRSAHKSNLKELNELPGRILRTEDMKGRLEEAARKRAPRASESRIDSPRSFSLEENSGHPKLYKAQLTAAEQYGKLEASNSIETAVLVKNTSQRGKLDRKIKQLEEKGPLSVQGKIKHSRLQSKRRKIQTTITMQKAKIAGSRKEMLQIAGLMDHVDKLGTARSAEEEVDIANKLFDRLQNRAAFVDAGIKGDVLTHLHEKLPACNYSLQRSVRSVRSSTQLPQSRVRRKIGGMSTIYNLYLCTGRKEMKMQLHGKKQRQVAKSTKEGAQSAAVRGLYWSPALSLAEPFSYLESSNRRYQTRGAKYFIQSWSRNADRLERCLDDEAFRKEYGVSKSPMPAVQETKKKGKRGLKERLKASISEEVSNFQKLSGKINLEEFKDKMEKLTQLGEDVHALELPELATGDHLLRLDAEDGELKTLKATLESLISSVQGVDAGNADRFLKRYCDASELRDILKGNTRAMNFLNEGKWLEAVQDRSVDQSKLSKLFTQKEACLEKVKA